MVDQASPIRLQLRCAIADGLPRREFTWERSLLIDAIERHICANDWRSMDEHGDPSVRRHREHLQKSAKIAVRLKGALEKADADLLELGARIEDAACVRVIDAPNCLRQLVSQTSQALQGWQSNYPSTGGTDPKPRVLLTAALCDYCKQAGLTGEETDELFDKVNATGLVPNLSRQTLAKRKVRAKKKTNST